MAAVRSGARQTLAAGALCLIAVLGFPWAAGAATMQYSVADAAVVQISARWASVTIRTWNRNVVQVEFPRDGAFAAFKTTVQTADRLFIRAVSDQERISSTQSVMVTLEPEDFPLTKLAQDRHDAVRVWQQPLPADPAKAAHPATLSVTIPESTGLLSVHVGRGAVTIHDYRGTTNAGLHTGRMVFDNVGGDAFVQPLDGRFYAVGSAFDFLRIRSNGADEVFDACRVREIQATTVTGNILYDNGAFDPGLARFESDRGSIALGVNGGAQLGAHSGDGRVLSALPAPPTPDLPAIAEPGFDRTRVAGAGGPLVNALSANGNVFLYAGSLADRDENELGPAWRPMVRLLEVNRRIARGTLHGPPVNHFVGHPQ